MGEPNLSRWRAVAAVALCGLLAGCATGDLRGGSRAPDDTSAVSTIADPTVSTSGAVTAGTTTTAHATTLPATTAAAVTLAATSTTIAVDPWRELSVAGLDEPAPPYSIGILSSGPGGFLIAGNTIKDGPPFVAVSPDGATWQKALGDDSPDVFQHLVPLDDGTRWTLLVSSSAAADGTGTVARYLPGSDGKFVVDAQFLTGLEFDDVVSLDDAPLNLTFSYDGPTHAIRLADGSYLAAGTGGWGRRLQSLDSTPYLAQSVDGQTWNVVPGPDTEQLTEETLLDLFDTPSGPLIAQEVTEEAGYFLRLQRADGTFANVFEQQHDGSHIVSSVEVVPSPDGVVLLYRALGVGVDERIAQLLTSTDGTSWQVIPLEFPDYPDMGVVDVVADRDQYILLGYATQNGGSTRTPLLLTGTPGAWTLEEVARFADLSPVAMAGTDDGGLLMLARDGNGASVMLTRGAAGG